MNFQITILIQLFFALTLPFSAISQTDLKVNNEIADSTWAKLSCELMTDMFNLSYQSFQYNKRKWEIQPTHSAEDLLEAAFKFYGQQKDRYPLDQNKHLFTKEVLESGINACRRMRKIGWAWILMQDRYLLYGDPAGHTACAGKNCQECTN